MRTFYILGVTFVITLCALQSLSKTAAIAALALSALLLLVCVLAFRDKKYLKYSLIVFGVFISSVLWLFTYLAEYEPVTKLAGEQVAVTCKICSEPVSSSSGYSYEVKVIKVTSENEVNMSFSTKLYSRETLDAEIFDLIDLTVLFSVNRDTELYAGESRGMAKGVYLTGIVVEERDNLGSGRNALDAFSHTVKTYVKSGAAQFLPGEEGALIIGIATGDKTALSDETLRSFSRSGLSHMIAVSGMHVSIIAQMFMGIAMALGLSKKKSALLSAGFVLLFAALCGFSVSVLRASVMTMIYFVSMLFSREADSLNSLGLAAVILLLIHPFSAFDVSFLLSFAGTLGIIISAERITKLLTPKFKNQKLQKLSGGIISTASVGISAAVFTFPVTMILFPQVSVMSVISGTLVLWMLPAVFACLFFSACFFALPFMYFLVYPLMAFAGIVSSLILFTARSIAAFPLAVIPSSFAFVSVVAVVLIAASALVRKLRMKKAWYAVCIILSLILLEAGVLAEWTLSRNLQNTAIITSERSSTIIVTNPGTVFVFGCPADKAGAYAISDYLKSCGFDRIDILVIDDPQKGTARGLDVIMRDFPVGLVLVDKQTAPENLNAVLVNAENVLPPSDMEIKRGESLAFLLSGYEDGFACTVSFGGTKMLLVSGTGSLPEEITGQEYHAVIAKDNAGAYLHGVSCEKMFAKAAPGAISPSGYVYRYAQETIVELFSKEDGTVYVKEGGKWR